MYNKVSQVPHEGQADFKVSSNGIKTAIQVVASDNFVDNLLISYQDLLKFFPYEACFNCTRGIVRGPPPPGPTPGFDLYKRGELGLCKDGLQGMFQLIKLLLLHRAGDSELLMFVWDTRMVELKGLGAMPGICRPESSFTSQIKRCCSPH